jgi:hypothetical protein
MSLDQGLVELPTWKDGRYVTSRYVAGSGPKPFVAERYMTREHTYGVDKGKDPHCAFCSHQVERVFSVTEATHNVELPAGFKGMAFACVSCWSLLSLQNPAQYEADEN